MLKNAVKYIVMFAGAALAAGLASCFPGMTDNSVKGPLEFSCADSIKVGKDPVKSYIGVTARDGGWTLTGDEDWCRATPAAGEKGSSQVEVAFTLNDTGGDRETAFLFVSGSVQKKVIVKQLATEMTLPDQNPEYGTNKAIHEEIINDWYLWYGETESTAADYNQQYDAFFNGYLTHLTKNGMDGNTWSYNTERYVYSYITRTPDAEAGQPPLNYGMEFDVTDYNVNRELRMVSRILYVMDGSPAAKAGLKRGDWFYKVNNRQMFDYNYTRLIDTLVKPVYGFSPKLGLLTFQAYASNLVDDRRTTLITPAHYGGSPILNTAASRIIESRDKEGAAVKVGYLVYNRFDPDYRSELTTVFQNFKANNITHLVLDLRYNNTGTVGMAELMANLIVPASLDGQTFARYEFNDKHAALNRPFNLSADAGSVGLNTVYILTSGHTAGAAEMLINGFRGLDGMTLVVIGDITEGMNVGMIRYPYPANGYTYNVYPAAFRIYNGKGEGDYQYGLTPNGGTVKEFYDSRDPDSDPDNAKWSDTWGWKGVVGKQEDRLLLQAMNYILKNAAIPAGQVLNAPSRQKSGYTRIYSVQPSLVMEDVTL